MIREELLHQKVYNLAPVSEHYFDYNASCTFNINQPKYEYKFSPRILSSSLEEIFPKVLGIYLRTDSKLTVEVLSDFQQFQNSSHRHFEIATRKVLATKDGDSKNQVDNKKIIN